MKKTILSLFLLSYPLFAEFQKKEDITAQGFNQKLIGLNTIILNRGEAPPNVVINSGDLISKQLIEQIHDEYSSLGITHPIPSCVNDLTIIKSTCLNLFFKNLETIVSGINGGIISVINENGINYRVHEYRYSGAEIAIDSNIELNVEYLIVAGGGGGGSGVGNGNAVGGGGAGGLIQGTTTLNNENLIYVGKGGNGGVGRVNSGTQFDRSQKGENSYINSLIAVGGGAGGNSGDSFSDSIFLNGGSGGGASISGTIGTPVAGQGNSGGTSNNIGSNGGWYAGGGGGGAGGVGGNGFNSGSSFGGAGVISSISGVNLAYAGGGGGSFYRQVSVTRYGGAGGSNCGGKGGDAIGDNTYHGGNGLDHRGCGGGAGNSPGTGYLGGTGGKGGTGVVIIRYPWKN